MRSPLLTTVDLGASSIVARHFATPQHDRNFPHLSHAAGPVLGAAPWRGLSFIVLPARVACERSGGRSQGHKRTTGLVRGFLTCMQPLTIMLVERLHPGTAPGDPVGASSCRVRQYRDGHVSASAHDRLNAGFGGGQYRPSGARAGPCLDEDMRMTSSFVNTLTGEYRSRSTERRRRRPSLSAARSSTGPTCCVLLRRRVVFHLSWESALYRPWEAAG